MKVKNLLEALSNIDPEMDIVVKYDDDWFLEATAIRFHRVSELDLQGVKFYQQTTDETAPMCLIIEH